MQSTRQIHRRKSIPRSRPRRERRRRSAFWILLEVLVIGALAGGAYVALDRLIAHPDEASRPGLEPEAAERDVNPPLDEWQRQGPDGWEKLFQEAAKGLPGYKVDVGLRPRRKLVELGGNARPLVVQKLAGPDFASRINAICILAQMGEAPADVYKLLERELRQAATGHDAFAVLKCAAVVPSADPMLIELSLHALGSSHPNTRRLAIDNLCARRDHPAAPRNLVPRLLVLLDDNDEQIRLLVAARFAAEGAPRTYRVLLAGINSADSGTVLYAARLTAQIRGDAGFPSMLAPGSEVDRAVAEQRKWLGAQLH